MLSVDQTTWVDEKIYRFYYSRYKFQILLIYTIEGSTFHSHVTPGLCTQEAQVWQFNVVTHLEN
jgi:hypothetical protein